MSEPLHEVQTKQTTFKGVLYEIVQFMKKYVRTDRRAARKRVKIDHLSEHLLRDAGIEPGTSGRQEFEGRWEDEIEIMSKEDRIS